MMNQYFQRKGKLPTNSLQILSTISNSIVTGLGKKLHWEPEDFVKTFKINKEKIFELGSGDLFIEFDKKKTLVLTTDSRRLSVIVDWIEGGLDTVVDKTGLWIEPTNINYSRSCWASLIGQRLSGIEIIKYDDGRVFGREGMNERGIVFKIKSRKFVFGHALSSVGPMESVIMDFEYIDKSILKKLRLVDV